MRGRLGTLAGSRGSGLQTGTAARSAAGGSRLEPGRRSASAPFALQIRGVRRSPASGGWCRCEHRRSPGAIPVMSVPSHPRPPDTATGARSLTGVSAREGSETHPADQEEVRGRLGTLAGSRGSGLQTGTAARSAAGGFSLQPGRSAGRAGNAGLQTGTAARGAAGGSSLQPGRSAGRGRLGTLAGVSAREGSGLQTGTAARSAAGGSSLQWRHGCRLEPGRRSASAPFALQIRGAPFTRLRRVVPV